MRVLLGIIGLILLSQADIRPKDGVREIIVAVRDQSGKSVDALKASEFLVEEDGVSQEIAHFSVTDSMEPTAFAVLVDNRRRYYPDTPAEASINTITGGPNPAFHSGLTGAKDLISRMKATDIAAVMTFSDRLKIEQDFTSSKADLEKRIQLVTPNELVRQTWNREITTFSAIDLALDKMRGKELPSQRVLVVFSNQFKEAGRSVPCTTLGNCPVELGKSNEDQLRKQFSQSGVTIYGFGIENGPPTFAPGVSPLEVLLKLSASETGGAVSMANVMTPDEQRMRALNFVSSVMAAVEARRNKEYVISYYPKETDRNARRITTVRTVSPIYRARIALQK